MNRSRTRVLVLAIVVALLLPMGIMTTIASHSSSVIHACIGRHGSIRVVDNASQCLRNFETAVTLPTETDLTAVQGQLGLLRSDVTTLQSTVATLQTDLSTLRTDLTTTQGDVGTLQTDVSTLRTDLTTVQGSVTTLQTDVSQLDTDLTTEATTRAQADADLASDISALVTAIATETANRQSADTALQASIDALQTALTNETNARIAGDLNCQQQAQIRSVAPGFQALANCPATLVATPSNQSPVVFTAPSQEIVFTVFNGGNGPTGQFGVIGYLSGGSGNVHFTQAFDNTCTNTVLNPGQRCSFTIRIASGGFDAGISSQLVLSASGLTWTLVYQP